MGKLMYKPLKKSYSKDLNDIVEDLYKGGPGSGIRGHKAFKPDESRTRGKSTQIKPGTTVKIKKEFQDPGDDKVKFTVVED